MMETLGRFTLWQSEHGFRLGGDTLALGQFATLRCGWQVCDLGCGSGALGLLLLGREPSLVLSGVELDPAEAAVARRNFADNGLVARTLTGDLRDPSLLPIGGFDLVVSNPPWFSVGSGKSGGPARMEECCSLDEVCKVAGVLLRNRGRFALVHRPERLADVFAALRTGGMEPKRLQFMQHGAGVPPSAVLVESVRQGKPGLDVLPVLMSPG